MSDVPVSPQWIDVSQVDDLRDVVHRAVASLAQGGVVGLGTETVYGLAACALRAEGVARVRELKKSEPPRPLTLLLKGPEEVTDWVPRISRVGQRMAQTALAGAGHARFPLEHGRWSVRPAPRGGQVADLS